MHTLTNCSSVWVIQITDSPVTWMYYLFLRYSWYNEEKKKKKNLFLQFIYLEILLVTRLNPHLEFKRWNLYPTKSKDLDFDYNYNCMAKSKKPKRLTFKSTFHRTQNFVFYLLIFSRVY